LIIKVHKESGYSCELKEAVASEYVVHEGAHVEGEFVVGSVCWVV
jgi:hypothetical protein